MIMDVASEHVTGHLWMGSYKGELAFSEAPSRISFCRGTAGSVRTIDVPVNPASAMALGESTELNGALITFVTCADREVVFRTDLTAAGTFELLSIPTESSSAAITQFCNTGTQVFFWFRRFDQNTQWQLWRTDGTSAGTVHLHSAPHISRLHISNDGVWWVGASLLSGEITHVWTSDGSIAGTVPVARLQQPVSDRVVPGLIAGSKFYFEDGVEHASSTLWALDTTAPQNGVRELPTPYPGCIHAIMPGPVDGTVIWSMDRPWLTTVYTTDGTSNETYMIDIISCDQLFRTTIAAGKLFAISSRGGAGQLWASDGTAEDSGVVRHIHPSGSDDVAGLTGAGSSVFFLANDGIHGRELWTSDGTHAGTRIVADSFPGPSSGMISNGTPIRAIGNRLFYQARVRSGSDRLWMLDLRPADFDNSGHVGVSDVLSYVQSYVCSDELADTNADGAIAVDDLFGWLSGYFADSGNN